MNPKDTQRLYTTMRERNSFNDIAKERVGLPGPSAGINFLRNSPRVWVLLLGPYPSSPCDELKFKEDTQVTPPSPGRLMFSAPY